MLHNQENKKFKKTIVITNHPKSVYKSRPNQKVRERRPHYAAATATYKETEAIKFLPIVVDRTDQKWATAATKQPTLKEVLDEIESRLGGKKPRFVAMKPEGLLQPEADCYNSLGRDQSRCHCPQVSRIRARIY